MPVHVARRIDHTKLHVLAVTVTLSQRHHHNRRHAYCIVQVSQCSRMSADSLSHCLLTSWRAPLTTSVSRACHERVTGSSTGATPRPHCTLPGTRDTCAALAATDDACWCVDNHCCVNNFARLFALERMRCMFVCLARKAWWECKASSTEWCSSSCGRVSSRTESGNRFSAF